MTIQIQIIAIRKVQVNQRKIKLYENDNLIEPVQKVKDKTKR